MSVRLVHLPLPVFHALASGDVAAAQRSLGLDIPSDFAELTEIWEFFIRLLSDQPESAAWAMHAVIHADVIVGNAGFKGAPDPAGQVEIGYGTLPAHRRRGYASAAVRLLLDRADAHPEVRSVLAVVNPVNDASVEVVTGAGLLPAGERMHARWGRQLLFTRVTPSARR